MKKKGLTFAIVLGHMQQMHDALVKRFDAADAKFSSLFSKLSTRIDHLDSKLSTQIQNIDDRLDIIEVAIVDQKHEQRITHLERHTGLTTSA